MNEARYSSLTRAFPERAKELFAQNEEAAKERWEHLLGTHGQSNRVTVHGRGDTAERGSFAVCGEARDVELVLTRWSCTSN